MGELFVYFCVDTVETIPDRLGNTIVGADFGLKTFLTLSNGEEIKSPEFFKTALNEIRHANRELSRKDFGEPRLEGHRQGARAVKGSNNRRKANDHLNRVHEKVTNQRRDWFYKLAHDLTTRFDVIVLETLNIKSMKRLWGRKVSDIAFAEFRDILQWVAKGKDKLVHFIDRWYPSSKTCSCCGHINHDLTLNDRRWRCCNCNTVVDRDLNAALNIEREGASSLKLADVRLASQAVCV